MVVTIVVLGTVYTVQCVWLQQHRRAAGERVSDPATITD